MAIQPSMRSMSAFGLSFKALALIALTLQASIHILVLRYSRTMPLVDGHRYFTSTAVLLNEVIKLAICLTMALYDIAKSPKTSDTSTAAALFVELARAVFTGDSWKLAIPAMLYTLQNSLQYIAISNLDAATFQVTNQLKILSTAFFSVLLLGRTLNGRKWLSLLLLMLGVAIVHLPASAAHAPILTIKDLRRDIASKGVRSLWDQKDAAADHIYKRSATYEGIKQELAAANPTHSPSFGLAMLAIACFISGLASVYFEKVLKEPKNEWGHSIWIRNVQLSFYSLWPALFIGVMFKDGEHLAKTGFFTGYNWVVWATILVQAAGGVLVAVVVKYADNIAKNFATSISILLSCSASVFLFDFEINTSYIVGTAIVLCATYIYNTTPDSSKMKAPQIRVPVSEKEKDEASYFDIDSVATPGRSPLRGDALSTSRPNTPSIERIPHKIKSPDSRAAKREQ